MSNSARLIDGNQIAKAIRSELAEPIQALVRNGVTPGLAAVRVGDDPASEVYVRRKRQACEELGMHSVEHHLPANCSQPQLLNLVDRLNQDPEIHGILVQLPLPDQIDENAVILAIDPDKDVDGFHPVNVGKMLVGQAGFLPCTPHGVQELLLRSGTTLPGKHVVIVGRSNIVGKPLAAMLVQKSERANATVTVCHSKTQRLAELTQQADILVAAIGRAEFIKAEHVKAGAVVIDVGMNRVEDASRKSGFRLTGDVAFEAVSEKAEAITPVPGGVGPMTITMLLKNTVLAAERLAR